MMKPKKTETFNFIKPNIYQENLIINKMRSISNLSALLSNRVFVKLFHTCRFDTFLSDRFKAHVISVTVVTTN